MGRTQIYPLLITTLCTIALTFCSCTDEPSGPTPPNTPDTTSHEFVWEVDTLFFRGTTQPVYFQAKAFYGTSASNVYMAGYSTSGSTCCWHWDGLMWEEFDIEPYSGRDIADIDGIDSSFIVFLSFDPGHPNGTRATGVTAYDNGAFWEIPLPFGTRNRTCLHVVARNEIYLAGADGIQRYDGTKWEWMLDSTDALGFEFQPTYVHKFDDGTLECVAFRVANAEPERMFRLRVEGGFGQIVDSFTLGQTPDTDIRFGHAIAEVGDQYYATGYGGTYIRQGGNWERIFDETGAFVGGSPNNLVIGEGYGTLWHYNGSTLLNLRPMLSGFVSPSTSLQTGTYLDSNLFLCGQNSGTREAIVVRGGHTN